MVGGSVVVVIDRGATIVILRSCVVDSAPGVRLSVTCTVNVDDPAALAVPLILPDEERLRPGGSAPEVMDHV